MADESLLVFSESQQQAIVGHALQHPNIWEILDEYQIDENWMVNNVLADCYKQLQEFRRVYGRSPKSAEEIVDFVTDDLIKASVSKTLTKCVEAKKRHPWDALEKHLTAWAKARHVYVSLKELAQKYNDGHHQEAYKLLEKAATELSRIEAVSGVEVDGFQSAAERVKNEEEERIQDAKNTIEFAIPYLQDITEGLLPDEVVLWGATSGAGKTEAGKIQASYTAKTLKEPVHYFALEANYKEIERRIKYGIAARMYREEHDATPTGMISFKRWMKCKLEKELDVYRVRAEEEFARDYSTLHIYYKRHGDFGINQLQHQMLKLKGKSRLIVLDHVHFLDLETNNEVREMSDLIKKIRKTANLIRVPIIMIAHITEKGVKHKELVPRKEDFYGASDLFKAATTAIMMAPVHGFSASDSRAAGRPTLLRIVKGRLDNAMQYYPGIVFFDSFTNSYTPYYSVGEFEKGNMKWKSLKGDLPYWINMDRNIVDVSDVE